MAKVELKGIGKVYGGAIYNDEGATLVLEGTTFTGNTAAGVANDIYNAGTLTFKGENTLGSGIVSTSTGVLNFDFTEGSTTTIIGAAPVGGVYSSHIDHAVTVGAGATLSLTNTKVSVQSGNAIIATMIPDMISRTSCLPE